MKKVLLFGLVLFALLLSGCVQNRSFTVPCPDCQDSEDCGSAEEFCQAMNLYAVPGQEQFYVPIFPPGPPECKFSCTTDSPEESCKQMLIIELNEFKSALENNVHTTSPQTFNFSMYGCSIQNDLSPILTRTDSIFCENQCGSPMQVCMLLEYPMDTFSFTKCLDIPWNTVFRGEKCTEKAGYELQNLREELPFGQYVLENKTQPTDTYPTICAYKKN